MSTQTVLDFNRNHPERMDDEVFLGNFDDRDFNLSVRWVTRRKGTVAYDIHGAHLGTRWIGSFPVFAKQDEVGKKYPEILPQLLPSKPTAPSRLAARNFTGIPFTRTGHFPDLIKTWCTRCDAPTRVQNKHTGKVLGVLTTDLSAGSLIVILENGSRLNREQFTVNWRPVICHTETHWD